MNASTTSLAEPSTDDSWADLLDSLLPTFGCATPAEFHIDSEERANWLVRKINEQRARAEQAVAWAAKEAERAEKEESRLVARFGLELEEFARQQLVGKKKRSINLPAGVIGFRKQPARLIVNDEPAATAWAKTHAPAVVVVVPATERLSKADLARAVSQSGEIPDGAEWAEETDKFYVKS